MDGKVEQTHKMARARLKFQAKIKEQAAKLCPVGVKPGSLSAREQDCAKREAALKDTKEQLTSKMKELDVKRSEVKTKRGDLVKEASGKETERLTKLKNADKETQKADVDESKSKAKSEKGLKKERV